MSKQFSITSGTIFASRKSVCDGYGCGYRSAEVDPLARLLATTRLGL